MKLKIFTFALASLFHFATMPSAGSQEFESRSYNQEMDVSIQASSLDDGLDMTDFYEKWS